MGSETWDNEAKVGRCDNNSGRSERCRHYASQERSPSCESNGPTRDLHYISVKAVGAS